MKETGWLTLSSVIMTYWSWLSNMMIGVSSTQNSLMLQRSIVSSYSVSQDRTYPRCVETHNCLHMPQGLAGGLISVDTAMALKVLTGLPCLVTALPMATRSAHVPTG